MDTLKIFDYEGTSIRTVMRNGEPWWVLKDVCKVLQLTEPEMVTKRLEEDDTTRVGVIARLDDDEKDRNLILPLGGEQELSIINESGLYNLILRGC